MDEKTIQRLKQDQHDYQLFCLLFLGAGLFLTIGFWLPEPYQIHDTSVQIYSGIIGAAIVFAGCCFGLSYLAKQKLKKHE